MQNRQMRYSLAVLIGTILLASYFDRLDKEALMTRIESRVKLPAEALPLNKYARYYGRDGSTVVAEYLESPGFPSKPLPPGQHNWVHVPEGQRRWVGNSQAFPSVTDGGCSVIYVSYYPKSERLTVQCGGYA